MRVVGRSKELVLEKLPQKEKVAATQKSPRVYWTLY